MAPRSSRFVASAVLGTITLATLIGGSLTNTDSSYSADSMRMAGEESCHEGTPGYQLLDAQPDTLRILQLDSAWTVSRGEGVVVAIVDSGVNGNDPRLAGAVLPGINLVGDDTDPRGWTDYYGHGTAIAGQIAAASTEMSSVVGVAPGVKILPVRVYAAVDDQTREAGYGLIGSRLADGIRAAADAGAQIINVSISTESASDEMNAAVAYATTKGSLVVASAGNVGDDLDISIGGSVTQTRYPAGSEGALGVTATSVPENVVTDASVHGPHVDIAAPGQNVPSLGLNTGDCLYAPSPETPKTSYATGYVSAAAALVAAAHPSETAAQWAYRLEASALRGNPDQRSDITGWGLVQPYQALTLVPGPDTRGPETPFFDSAAVDAVPQPEPMVIAPPGNQHATDMQRVVLVGAVAVGALGLVGAISAFRNGRRRAQA